MWEADKGRMSCPRQIPAWTNKLAWNSQIYILRNTAVFLPWSAISDPLFLSTGSGYSVFEEVEVRCAIGLYLLIFTYSIAGLERDFNRQTVKSSQ